MHFSLCFHCCQINKGLLFFSFLFTLLKCKGIFSFFGGTSNTRFGMSPPAQQSTNILQLSAAAVTRECENIYRVLIQNTCDGMVYRCHRCQNAGGNSFSNE